MELVRTLVSQIAKITRKYHATRLDPFLRFIHNPDKKNTATIQTTLRMDNGLIFHLDTASYLEWTLFFYGHYEPIIGKLIKQFVRTGDCCLDVGANIGIHTLAMAQQTGPTGSVIACEPHPLICQKLQKNRTLNAYSWITIEELALSSAPGEAILYGFDGHDANQGTSSLLALHDNKTCTFTVSVTTLDTYAQKTKLSSLDFIKIDVEGYEEEVIMGGLESIEHWKPVIIFEHNKKHPGKTSSILGALKKFDYTFHQIFYAHTEALKEIKNPITASNILAVPPQRS